MSLWTKYKGLATLALLVAVAPAVVWQYALSGTVGQWRATEKYHRQITELRATQTVKDRPEISTTGREIILSGKLVGALLPAIEAEKLRIEHFSPQITSEADGITLATGQLTVQGGFTGIVKLLDRLERELPHCKIISAHYRTSRPRSRNEAKTLSCTIYVQQITAKTE